MVAYGTTLMGTENLGLMEIVLVIVEVYVLVRVFRWAAPTERAWMRALLALVAGDGGVIDEAELGAATGGRKARKAYLRTIPGHHEKTVAKHVIPPPATSLTRSLTRSLMREGRHRQRPTRACRSAAAPGRGRRMTDWQNVCSFASIAELEGLIFEDVCSPPGYTLPPDRERVHAESGAGCTPPHAN
jgi:hypothetical protein